MGVMSHWCDACGFFTSTEEQFALFEFLESGYKVNVEINSEVSEVWSARTPLFINGRLNSPDEACCVRLMVVGDLVNPEAPTWKVLDA